MTQHGYLKKSLLVLERFGGQVRLDPSHFEVQNGIAGLKYDSGTGLLESDLGLLDGHFQTLDLRLRCIAGIGGGQVAFGQLKRPFQNLDIKSVGQGGIRVGLQVPGGISLWMSSISSKSAQVPKAEG